MNTNAFFRSTMANNFATRKFFKRVASDMESQLKEWHKGYQVSVETWRIYSLCVQIGENTYQVALSKNLVDILQHEAPYALDRALWRGLVSQGLTLQKTQGNYLDTVLDAYDYEQQKLAL
ncbi:hypothetical protein [Rummeliibacillus suwonensis]|uniref:hypothetical protein n=1 Tax=Rummeliibacillus suwonensis TaxID=1306154 RepID=UPI002899612F|nr:hypothetical protein [Rummeliibacillus suwonensis]